MAQMPYTFFGSTGMEVSRLCLGAMTFGTKGLAEVEACGRVLDEGLAAGVNFIDTADSYGRSEEILGQVLDPPKREQIYLATKVYARHCRAGRVARNSRTNILNSLERSLRLLRTSYVDLYMLHHPDPHTPLDETMQTLDQVVRQGKVRHVGVSNHYAWQIGYMLGRASGLGLVPPVSLQANYNLIDRQIERETVPLLERFNLGLMCYSPLSAGILTGKFHTDEAVDAQARAAIAGPYIQRAKDETVARVVRRSREIADQLSLKLNQLAIQWLLSKPYVSTVILGGSRPEHYAALYQTVERVLPEQVVLELDELSAARVDGLHLNQPIRNGFGLAPGR